MKKYGMKFPKENVSNNQVRDVGCSSYQQLIDGCPDSVWEIALSCWAKLLLSFNCVVDQSEQKTWRQTNFYWTVGETAECGLWASVKITTTYSNNSRIN
jgi:hypothetical protein